MCGAQEVEARRPQLPGVLLSLQSVVLGQQAAPSQAPHHQLALELASPSPGVGVRGGCRPMKQGAHQDSRASEDPS